MSNELSKKEFLKRYLEKEKDSERKRKKKTVKYKSKVNVPSLKIVDKDIDLKSINFGDKAEDDEDDEAPIIAEIIDERPIEEKVKELYESARWKKIDNDDNSQADSAIPYKGSQNEDFKIESSQERFNYERNAFAKRGQNNSKRTKQDSDSDMSPPRNQEKRKRHDSGSLSPFRGKKQNNSNSDISPPRSQKQYSNKRKFNSNCKISPAHHHLSRSDTEGRYKPKRHDSDSDISPPRHILNKSDPQKHKSKRQDSDSDISPPRHKLKPRSNRCNSDNDISPHRKIGNKANSQIKNTSKIYDSDSNEMFSHSKASSPMRLKGKSRNLNENKQRKNEMNSDSDMSPPRSSSELSSAKVNRKKLDKTLSGMKAGLQNSKMLQKEIQAIREKEKNHLNTLDDEISGRNADTIIRDRKTGLKRDLKQEQESKNEENRKAKEYEKKYAEWGKGIEQTQDKRDKFENDLYEMSKPLARYRNDEDLDERLKSIIHDDDPMSEYMKKKRQKVTPSVPLYTGPPAPPNRFGILPGYRWDGVDRSTGFEKKYFEKINKSKAVEREAYLWSVQDM